MQVRVGAGGERRRIDRRAVHAFEQQRELGFVRRDEVALRKQGDVERGRHRRRVQHAQHAVAAGERERRRHRVLVVFQLQQQHARMPEYIRLRLDESRIEVLVGGEVGDDQVRPARVDDDARGRGRDVVAYLPAARQPFVRGEALRDRTEVVVADRADEHALDALARAGDGLVETLSAGTRVEAEREACFADLRKAVGEPGMILDVRVDDDDLRVLHADSTNE